tara:strand:+ start:96 stop:494 length:399 start_codon:yes stop_codon:yes gene_type:complete
VDFKKYGEKLMKMYNNGQRPAKMYGGGMVMPRKPMQMGGLAQQNRKMTTGMAGMENPMGRMTEKKRYDMGMKGGGKAETKVAASSLGMNKYGLAAKKVGNKYESYKDGKLTGTFKSIEELRNHQLQLISPKA